MYILFAVFSKKIGILEVTDIVRQDNFMYDIIIIGAGIVGTMLARDLSKYQLSVAILDKENDVANETSMANSAIVHTGYDPEDNTLKAKLNVEGARMYEQLCKDLSCEYEKVGAFVAACGKQKEQHLDVLAERAKQRNIPYKIYTGEEARQLEPHLADGVTKVIDFYTTAIIYPWHVALAACEVAVNNGVELYLQHEVTSITKCKDSFIIHTTKGDFETRMVLNAAGVWADKIDAMVSHLHSFTMHPKKGEYFVFDKDADFMKHIVFPVPSEKGKGVLVVPTVYGNTLIGPNAEESEYDTGTSNAGLTFVKQSIAKTVKDVPWSKVIRTFAGLRPSSTSKDFIIAEAKDALGFVNIASIESPGLASSPAISQYVIQHFVTKKFVMIEKKDAIMTHQKPIVLSALTPEERNAKILENPKYGNIICRCETISEGEIVDCIHSTIGARSVKGVKKRVRPGMGRCQGGFCEPMVVSILARELNISPLEVVLDDEESKILFKENRS